MSRQRTPVKPQQLPLPDDRGLLTPEQVAAVLQVTPRLVRALWERGELGGVKIGRFVRHRREDVDAYVKSQATKHTNRPTACN